PMSGVTSALPPTAWPPGPATSRQRREGRRMQAPQQTERSGTWDPRVRQSITSFTKGLGNSRNNGHDGCTTATDAKVKEHQHSIVPNSLEHPLPRATPMKKLINRPRDVVEEMVEGLAAAYPGLRRLPGQTVLIRSDFSGSAQRPVAVISGGGSG